MQGVKIIIEVKGGMVTNILSNEDIDIYLIDHDNIEVGKEDIDELLNPENPSSADRVMPTDELLDELRIIKEEYKEVK